jgi:hypothetical protein
MMVSRRRGDEGTSSDESRVGEEVTKTSSDEVLSQRSMQAGRRAGGVCRGQRPMQVGRRAGGVCRASDRWLASLVKGRGSEHNYPSASRSTDSCAASQLTDRLVRKRAYLYLLRGGRARCDWLRRSANRDIGDVTVVLPGAKLLSVGWLPQSNGKITCPSATLSTTDPTWIDQGAKPDLRSERLVTNDLSHVTAYQHITALSSSSSVALQSL